MKISARTLRSLIVIAAGIGLLAAARPDKPKLPEPKYKVRVEKNVMIPMRDGVKMATDIYYPIGLDRAPVVLTRTPYGKKIGIGRGGNGEFMAGQGYIFINQDVRGRFGSGGDFYPFLHDGADGVDMIAWIQHQSWYNGKLGTVGASYLGATQWFEAPGQDIAAMHLVVTSPRLDEVMYRGGELSLNTVFFWSTIMGEHQMDMRVAPMLPFAKHFMSILPLGQADDRIGRDVDYFNDALNPAEMFKVYQQMTIVPKFKTLQAPAVFVAGWYDMFLGPELKDFAQVMAEGGGNSKQSVLVVGPWCHGPNTGDGSVDFGPDQGMDQFVGAEPSMAWFDHWLRGADNEVKDWPRVRIFIMGENKWRAENEWPLARTQYTDYYLHSNGAANTCGGNGSISTAAPAADEPEDKFAYDPKDPAPSTGGNNLGLDLGPKDQRKVEKRKDVLCFTTPALAEGVEVTGPISAVIYAASDAADTDFSVKLVDVWPDGKAVNIQDGIVRAMYRDNDPTRPTPLQPGAVEQYKIDLWASSNLFQPGHRIRVEVSSSEFPRYNRNLNTGEPIPDATRTVVAHQTIYHDPAYPSHIILPVIPR